MILDIHDEIADEHNTVYLNGLFVVELYTFCYSKWEKQILKYGKMYFSNILKLFLEERVHTVLVTNYRRAPT